MRHAEIARLALQGLAAHGLRASLSALGVVCGVATIVAALAVGEGARRRAYEDVAALGVDNVFVRSRPPAEGYPPPPRFRPADLRMVALSAGGGSTVAGARRLHGRLRHASHSIQGELAAVTPGWREVAGLEVARGRWFDAADLRDRRRVIVLSAAAAHALFAEGEPVGSMVRWGDDWLVVVGVLSPPRRLHATPVAYAPHGAIHTRIGQADDGTGVQEIAVRSAGADPEAAAADAARALRAGAHPAEAIEVVVPRALLRARLAAQRTFDWVMLGVGGLALAISGIGIMNIMLASVAARTPEIGVRRAAGARRRDVLAQFAAEATLLCLAGGLAGVPAGVLLAAVVAAGAGWPVAISGGTVLLALGTAAVVGLACGIYPAYRAARLDPVAALRD